MSLLRVALWGWVGACALLAGLPFMAEADGVAAWMAEDGVVERASVLTWALAALYLLWRSLAPRGVALAFALVFVTLAVREAGLPPEWVPSGKQLMSWRYYVNPDIDVGRRLITGGLMAAVIVSFATSIRAGWRYVIREEGWRYPDGQMLLLSGATLVLAQGGEAMVERLLHAAAAGDAWPRGLLVALSLEEGLEWLGSVFALVAVKAATTWMGVDHPARIFPVRISRPAAAH